MQKVFYRSVIFFVVILLTIGGTLTLIGLGDVSLGSSEARWGNIAREMLLWNDWVTPRINGIPYRDKPVGSYWLILLFSHARNRVTETTTRLPSALAAMVGALCLFFILRHFWDGTISFVGALIFLMNFSLIYWGRKANADVLTVTGMLGCVWLFLKLYRGEGKGGVVWLYPFFVVAGITSLMKGIIGFVLPVLAVFPFLFLEDWRRLINRRFLLHLFFAFLIGLVLFFIPYVMDLARNHTAEGIYLVFKENILRFVHPFDHKGSPCFYCYYIFYLILPWPVWLPLVVLSLRKEWDVRDKGFLFFGSWALATFVFFSLSGSKRGYYLLPILAPLSALIGYGIVSSTRRRGQSRGERVAWLIPFLASILGGFSLLLVPFLVIHNYFPRYQEGVTPFAYLCGIILIVTGLLGGWTVRRKNFFHSLFCFLGGTYLFYAIFFWFVSPAVAHRDPFRIFWKRVVPISEKHPVALYGVEGRGVFYFYLKNYPVPRPFTPALGREFLLNHPNSYMIVKGKEDLEKLGIKYLKIVEKEGIEDPFKAYYLVTLPSQKGPP